jgi:cytochrome c-type biogenesis protein CcmF
MVEWIWFGCLMMAFGGFLALADKRYRLKKRAPGKEAKNSKKAKL